MFLFLFLGFKIRRNHRFHKDIRVFAKKSFTDIDGEKTSSENTSITNSVESLNEFNDENILHSNENHSLDSMNSNLLTKISNINDKDNHQVSVLQKLSNSYTLTHRDDIVLDTCNGTFFDPIIPPFDTSINRKPKKSLFES